MKRDILGLSCLLILCIVVFCIQHALKKRPRPSPVAAPVLDTLEQELLKGDSNSYVAYRKLVNVGHFGWKIIARHEYGVRSETDHLRVPIDTGSCVLKNQEGFHDYMTQLLIQKLEDEKWAMAYAKSCAEAYSRSALWLPVHIEKMRKNLDNPEKLRFEVASLRHTTQKTFGYAWHGSVSDQRAAVLKMLAFWEVNKDEYAFGH